MVIVMNFKSHLGCKNIDSRAVVVAQLERGPPIKSTHLQKRIVITCLLLTVEKIKVKKKRSGMANYNCNTFSRL